MQHSVTHRDIVEEPRFVEECKRLEPDAKRLDAILRGVTFVLSHSPQHGRPTSEPGIFAVPTDPYPDAPAFVIYYSFDAAKVYLKSITRADEEALREIGDDDIDIVFEDEEPDED